MVVSERVGLVDGAGFISYTTRVMQAVIQTGSKQYLVEPGQTLEIDLVEDTKKLSFEPLLVIDGAKIQVGAPFVEGVPVAVDVLGEIKGDKLKVLKFQAKKRVNTKTGHRQRYTRIKILSIGSVKASTKSAEPKSAASKSPK